MGFLAENHSQRFNCRHKKSSKWHYITTQKNILKANHLVRVSHRSLIKSQIKHKKGGSCILTGRFLWCASREDESYHFLFGQEESTYNIHLLM